MSVTIKPGPEQAFPPSSLAETRFKMPPDLEVVVDATAADGSPRVRVEPTEPAVDVVGAKGRFLDVRG